jgi:tRNA threonylcarbamoyladenosine modification (KEOPS) complex Cgi121 subunit
MMKTSKISGSNWIVTIGGFNVNSIKDIDDLLREINDIVAPNLFQIFDADRIAGWRHIFMAAVNAVTAFESGSAISRSIGIEILLYASCQDQISKALEIVGASTKTKKLALVVLSKSYDETEITFIKASSILGKPDDTALNLNDEKIVDIMNVFEITESQINTIGGEYKESLTNLLIEKGALVALRH